MDKNEAKGKWISKARKIDQELFDEYLNKVATWLNIFGEVFANDKEPLGKEWTYDSNLAIIYVFPSIKAAIEAFKSEEYKKFQYLEKN